MFRTNFPYHLTVIPAKAGMTTWLFLATRQYEILRFC
jgi:hypothetical protein